MVLRLSDKWLWDFWFARDGAGYHVFYLQADRSLKDPELRHWNVTIGHAVSQDLRTWQRLPDVLAPSRQTPAWDDCTTWTGSIIRHKDLWYMLYTGSSRAENGLVQRIGLATSPDLMRWDKHPNNPCITIDAQWYELLDLTLWHDQAWRDPYLFYHQARGKFYAYLTARVNTGPVDGRGVIGYAQSSDLVHWEVCPPITRPGEFGQMEVPQIAKINGRYYLLFSTMAEHHSAARRARTHLPPVTGTHYLVADDPLGPFRYLSDTFLVGDALGTFYSGKLVEGPDGGWFFMAWRFIAADGAFVGELSDPMPVSVGAQGELKVQQDSERSGSV